VPAEFSITTDLVKSKKGNVSPEFRAFAAAGFKAVHWCQHWAGEPVFYAEAFAKDVKELADRHGLRVADVHGYSGTQGGPTYTDELFLAANVNRAEFAHRLGADVLVLHLPLRKCPEEQAIDNTIAVLKALRPACQAFGVRVATENLFDPPQTNAFFDALFAHFDSDYLGFCYDSGHALMTNQVDLIARHARRLIATHLHDNNGREDQHLLPGEGKVDWATILGAIRSSGYRRPLNLEVHKSPGMTLDGFCKRAYRVISGLPYS